MHVLPRLTRFLAVAALANIAVLGLFRVIFWWYFDSPNDPAPLDAVLNALYLGMKFDLRLTLLALLPLAILGWFRWFSPFDSLAARRFWTGYLTLASGVILLFYVFDFGHYAYLHTRINQTVLRFLANPDISFSMMWESYPVVPIVIGLLLMTAAYGFAVRALFVRTEKAPEILPRRRHRVATVTLSLFLVLFGIYGKFSWYPLRWSDAFFSTHQFTSSIAVNPVLYFYDTFKNGGVEYDEKQVATYYDDVADFLGVQQKSAGAPFNFARYTAASTEMGKPNVVLVFLESFAYYKAGLSGNPLNPTPHVDRLAENGLFFDRFYIPHTGTARSVFATITGIPDVKNGETSTRNPAIVNQHTLVSAFKDYSNFYFLGGSANWGNIRGVLSHNIPGLKLYEEGSYASPRIDVWGISDLDLFKEANQVLRDQKEPFFAVIQTSGNHRPYTIPDDNHGFEKQPVEQAQARRYGFESEEEFNSFRFMDHSVGYFMETARNEAYFDNTIFVFYGDHGISGDAGEHSPKAETQLSLGSYHTPLIIYAPKLLPEPRRFHKIGSHLDILPTLAAMTGHSHVNTTFGRNLLDERFDDRRYAFTIHHSAISTLGLISDDFVFRVGSNGANSELFQLGTDTPRENVIAQHPELAEKMRRLTLGIYETAKYVVNNNSREQAAEFAAAQNN